MSKRNELFIAYLWLVLLSAVTFVGSASFTMFSFNHKIIVGSILYYALTAGLLRFNKKIQPRILVLGISLPLIIVLIVFNFFNYAGTFVSLPSNLFILISVLGGGFFYHTKNYIIPAINAILILLWVAVGAKMYHNHINYGNLSGQVYESYPGIKLYDSTGLNRPLNTEKTIVLDLWNSHCGVCYQQFPLVDSISRSIDTSKYEILVVNIPFKLERKQDNYKLLDKFSYTFQERYTDNAEVMDLLKVQYFPTTIVVKNQKILFRGDFSDALQFAKSR